MLHVSKDRGLGIGLGLVLGIAAYFLVVWALPLLARLTWIYT